jgi:phosphoglycolate phosphatase-like HAD superfamily hydrolase
MLYILRVIYKHQKVAVTWGYSPKQKLVALKPDFLVDTVGELEKYLLN